MELQQLRYVVALAEERSFTRAAERCFVVQSALSHQIKALERELGVALFARTSRRVETTAAGAAFLGAARESLAAADRAAARASGEIRGTLAIGMIPTVTAIDIPAALAAFHRAHPGVRIQLRGGGSDELVAAIEAGSLDVAVLGLPDDGAPPRGVAARLLVREPLVAVLPAGHPLADRRRLRLGDIAGEAFVDFPEGTPGRIPSDRAFQAAGLRREVAFEATSTGVILDLVRHGLVIALLARALIPADRGLRAVPLADGPVRAEYLAWSGFNPSPAAEAFVDGPGSARRPAE